MEAAANACRASRSGAGGVIARGGGQRGLDFGEGGEFGLPSRFQGSCHEPVLRFDLAEGTFGTVGFVADAFDG